MIQAALILFITATSLSFLQIHHIEKGTFHSVNLNEMIPNFHVNRTWFYNTNYTLFFEKCKQKFLHGVDMFLTFDEREICYELDYLDICNMAQMYLNYKSM